MEAHQKGRGQRSTTQQCFKKKKLIGREIKGMKIK